MQTLGRLLLLAVVVGAIALLLPIGLAISDTWSGARTDSLLMAGTALCGSALGLAAVVATAVLVSGITTRRRDSAPPPAQPYTMDAPGWSIAPPVDAYRAAQIAKLQAEAQRSAIRLEQERRQLMAPPAQPAEPVPPAWQRARWELVDDTGAGVVDWPDDNQSWR